ncbi:MAG TPA: hypothetical protein VFU21_13320 [Kofleriaceae bacterium]|nr:hypothetical protein [Kofleriaceae bacterium]
MPLGRWLLQSLFACLLVVVVSAGASVLDLDTPSAWAQDDEDDEGDDEDEDDEDGGGGDDEEDEDDEEGEEEDEDQPPVTAGGMYTKQSWPVMENLRPMTLNRGMFEIRTGFNMDLSALDAFETWRVPIDAKIGLRDHVELQAGVDFLLVTTQSKQDAFEQFGSLLPPLDAFVVNIGLESALYYDLVDFRLALDMPINPGVPGNEAPDCETVDETAPCGLTPPVPFTIDIVVGFPFRWAPKKQFAVVGLDKLFTVHTIDGSKPDLTAQFGFVINPLEILAVFLRAEFIVPEFNTNFLLIPASAAVQFSPNNRFDIGLQFGFNNIKPTAADEAADVGPFDRRFLLLYAQARF